MGAAAVSRVWTPERLVLLEALHAQGLPASRIAVALDCTATRNAVIGMLYRLRMRRRAALLPQSERKPRPPAERQTAAPRDNATRAARAAKAVLLHAQLTATPIRFERAMPPPPASRQLTFEALQANDCRWPSGEGPYLFCGHPCYGNRSYCEHHTRRAYVQPSVQPLASAA